MTFQNIMRCGVIVAALALSGCITVSNVRLTSFNPGCMIDSSMGCRIGIKGRWDFQHKTSIPGTGSVVDVLAMLSNQSYLTVATSRVRLLPTAGNVTVKLTLGEALIASQTTAWYRSGNRIYLNNPDAVKAWLQSYGDAADGVSLDFDEMALEATGSEGQLASVTLTAEVGGVTVASATSSGLLPAGGDSGCRFGGCSAQ